MAARSTSMRRARDQSETSAAEPEEEAATAGGAGSDASHAGSRVHKRIMRRPDIAPAFPFRSRRSLRRSRAHSSNSLHINESHHRFGISRSGCDSFRCNFVDAGEIFRRELDIGSGDVLFEISASFGAWNRNDVLAFSKHPR